MEWLWIIQLGINLIWVATLFVWWKERGSTQSQLISERASQLEMQAAQWEQDAALLKRKTEDQLRFLVRLCEQAHAILLRHGSAGVATVSLEEEELKALRNQATDTSPARTIPSVLELEARKQSIRPEIPLDLRSLLRDQLT